MNAPPVQPPPESVGSVMGTEALAGALDALTFPGSLSRAEGNRMRCVACAHRCLIAPGRRGICKVRFNRNGELRVPYGYVAGLQSDPVEKKPFFHLCPGSMALTFGMVGCNFRCDYCQNWVTSQALKEPLSRAPVIKVTPEEIVDTATANGAQLLVSSYNEPLITAEWAESVFREGKQRGLKCAVVSNGYATPEVLDHLRPVTDAYKIDLKCFDDRRHRTLGGVLARVLDGIRMVYERGFWLEVVTLLVPGFNDDESELKELAAFLSSVSPDIPWHVTAFHKDYRMTEPDNTRAGQLERAAEIGRQEGLRFVYAGNAPGRVGDLENTTCPGCGAVLVARSGYRVRVGAFSAGRCARCQTVIPGLWT